MSTKGRTRITYYRGCTVYGPYDGSGWYIDFSVKKGPYRYDIQMDRRGPLAIMRKIRETVARVNEESKA